jgi:hypothetical protein
LKHSSVKYSKAPYATVIVLTEYCAEHQENEQYLVIGYIINPAKRTESLENDFLDYLWERGFRDNLCLRI